MMEKVLQAMLKDGTLITLANYSRKEIEHFRAKKTFLCPTCKSPVIIKAGKQVIPHFAHLRKDDCPKSFGEGPEHQLGKIILYNWLLKQKLPVSLEKYLPEINQIPDLMLTIKKRKIAIEYQRAIFSKEEFIHRTLGYQKEKIIPIWILGENHLHPYSSISFKITPLMKYFIHKFSRNCKSTLYFFSPKDRQFIFLQDLYFTSNQRALARKTVVPLGQANFLHFFRYNSFQITSLYRFWQKEKSRFRIKPMNYVQELDRKWLEWLYARRTHREYLPSIVNLPVRNQLLMKSPLENWQSRIIVDVLHPLQIGDRFSIRQCFYLLKNDLIHQKYYPLYSFTEHPVVEYLSLLEELGFVRKSENESYVKLKSIEFNKNIEDAIINDKLLINRLMKRSKYK